MMMRFNTWLDKKGDSVKFPFVLILTLLCIASKYMPDEYLIYLPLFIGFILFILGTRFNYLRKYGLLP